MAANDEMICSEVHTFTTNSITVKQLNTKISRFRFSNPLKKVELSTSCQQEKVSISRL